MSVAQDSSIVSGQTGEPVLPRPSGLKIRPVKSDSIASPDTAAASYFVDSVTFTSEKLVKGDTHPERYLLKRPIAAPLPVTELFGEHRLKRTHKEVVDRSMHTPDWLFPLVMLMIAMLTWLRVFYARYFSRMFTTLYNVNLANQIVRDENVLLQKATIYLNLFFCLSTSLFLYVVSLKSGWKLDFVGTGIGRYFFLATVVFTVYLFKFLVFRFCGWLFYLERELSAYLFTVFISNNLAGLILFPIAIIMIFNPSLDDRFLTILSFMVVGITYLYRLIRGIMIGVSAPQVRPLYIIFYLCTLELAPLSILFRLTVWN